jgi:hypothetical protein
MRNFPAQLALAAFAMDDATWERHPNPWSVYTRMLGLPLIALAVWGCAWIGWWSLVPIAAVAVWLWLNPRKFPPRELGFPRSAGRSIWLARDRAPIPRHNERAARLLSTTGAVGVLPFLYGLAMLEVWPTLLGISIAFLAKLWLMGRMAWL